MPEQKTNMTELETTLKQHFDQLPQDVQEAILSVNYERVLKDITQRYRLHIDQGARLETETTLVMLGLSPPKDYSKNLIFEAKIEPKIAEPIVAEVNEKIFRPIISSLHAVLTRDLGDVAEQESPEDTSRDLSPVEIGVATVKLPEKNQTNQESPGVIEQKLTSITGLKSAETVVSDAIESKKENGEEKKEEPPKPSLYRGKADPYHEPID